MTVVRRSDAVFWMTTGLYPQEFIVTFKEPIEIREIRFVTSNGKRHRRRESVRQAAVFSSQTVRHVLHEQSRTEEFRDDLGEEYVGVIDSVDVHSRNASSFAQCRESTANE